MKKAKIYTSKIITEFFESKDSVGYKKMANKMMMAAKIMDVMNDRQISKKELATRLNVQPSVITKWISGGQNFTIDTLTEIEHELKIELLKL